MSKLKNIIKEINWFPIYVVLEYIIDLYVVLMSVLNLLNKVSMISFEKWTMQPSFWGASLLSFLLLQNGLAVLNNSDVRLIKLRPYVTGLLVGGVISTVNTPLILLLLLELGYILLTGFGTKFNLNSGMLTALVACVGIELYSVVMMINKKNEMLEEGFMHSIWSDVLFVMVVVIYCVVNKGEKDGEKTTEKATHKEGVQKDIGYAEKEENAFEVLNVEVLEEENEEKTLREKLLEKITPIIAWVNTNAKLLFRCIGGGLCILSLGLFLFYAASVFAGGNKIENSAEEVYLLKNCEDTSLVLTMVEGEENDAFTVAFKKYTGSNNQKVQIYDRGDELYQLVFVENEYAMEVKLNEESGEYVLGVGPMSDSFEQCWVKQAFIPEQQMYKFLCAYYVPLSYPMLGENREVPKPVVQVDTGGYEFFALERTVADEFVTEMVMKHGEEFAPTLFVENLIERLGIWSLIAFIVIVLLFCVIIYARRLVGDKPAVLCALMLAFLFAYASLWAVVLFLFVFGVLCINGYLRRREKKLPYAIKQYQENLPEMAQEEMQYSLEKLEKSLEEIKAWVNK